MAHSADPLNQLLAALPPDEFQIVHPHMIETDLAVGRILFNPGDIIQDVFFPMSAIISMMAVMNDGQTVEVVAVGNEGMAGIRLFYDDDEAFARAICQAPGQVVKVAAETFWKMVKTLPGMRHIIHHYAHAFLIETFQSAACNRSIRFLSGSLDGSSRSTIEHVEMRFR